MSFQATYSVALANDVILRHLENPLAVQNRKGELQIPRCARNDNDFAHATSTLTNDHLTA